MLETWSDLSGLIHGCSSRESASAKVPAEKLLEVLNGSGSGGCGHLIEHLGEAGDLDPVDDPEDQVDDSRKDVHERDDGARSADGHGDADGFSGLGFGVGDVAQAEFVAEGPPHREDHEEIPDEIEQGNQQEPEQGRIHRSRCRGAFLQSAREGEDVENGDGDANCKEAKEEHPGEGANDGCAVHEGPQIVL